MNRERVWRRGAIVIAALAVIVFVSVTALGFPGGVPVAVALGTGTALAVFSGNERHNCVPRFLRRRD